MAMECTLLYVSRATIAGARLDDELAAIIATSLEHNARAGITGALVRAGGYFAQLLEGSTEAVKAVMERIDRDPRHTEVSVVHVAASAKRQLGNWSMAYSGESTWLARQITPLLGQGLVADAERVDRLIMLIVAFASM